MHAMENMRVTNLMIISFLTIFFAARCNKKTAFYSNDCQAEVYEIVNLDSIKTNAIAFDNMPIEVNGYFYMNIENTNLYNNGNENRIWLV